MSSVKLQNARIVRSSHQYFVQCKLQSVNYSYSELMVQARTWDLSKSLAPGD